MKKLILVGVLAVGLMILGFKNSSRKEYEFYDLEGKYGTSSNCSNKELIECEIDGVMVEVAQYSEVNR